MGTKTIDGVWFLCFPDLCRITLVVGGNAWQSLNPLQSYVDDPSDDVPLNPETEAGIDAALERARLAPPQPDILEAVYYPGPVHDYMMVRLSDGRRLLIPRETLSELRDATEAQIHDMRIPQPANMIWWPQLDDGLYLPECLAHRWHSEKPESECPFVGAEAA